MSGLLKAGMKTVDTLMVEGLASWQRFMRGKDDADADRLHEAIAAFLPTSDGFGPTDHIITRMSARWCHYGFPLIDIASHKYAAALAVTDAPDVIAFPWPTFVVRIPPGIISNRSRRFPDRGDVAITTIVVSSWSGSGSWSGSATQALEINALPADGYYAGMFTTVAMSQVREACRGDLDSRMLDTGAIAGDARNRVSTVVMRLVVSAATSLLARREGSKTTNAERDSRPATQPSVRRFVLGHTIDADFREAIRDYISCAKPALRKIQWMVRGHWRNQAHGEGMRDRRLLWVEPHWAKRKGAPDDAPIPLRAHAIGQPNPGSTAPAGSSSTTGPS